MKELQKTLLGKEIKPTFIRLKILDYLYMHEVHPTAEMIYKKIVKEIPTISRTSIYNSLNLFCEKGLITPLFLTGMEARFESGKDPHHHFLCERCGNIIDLHLECGYFKRGKLKGHRIKELHSCFRGICNNCLQAEKKNV